MSCVPIIDQVIVAPDRIPPGGTATITILARDPCAAEGALSGVLRDTQGQETPVTVIVRTGGALRYRMTAPAGTIVQDPLHPNIFRFTAPLEEPAHRLPTPIHAH